MEFLLSSGEKAESKFLMVNLAVPKFDVASDMELKKDLMNLVLRISLTRKLLIFLL